MRKVNQDDPLIVRDWDGDLLLHVAPDGAVFVGDQERLVTVLRQVGHQLGANVMEVQYYVD